MFIFIALNVSTYKSNWKIFFKQVIFAGVISIDIDLEIAIYYNNLCKFMPKNKGDSSYGLQYDWLWQK